MGIKVYSTPTCGYCHQAKAFLKERGIQFTDVDVSRDRAAAREVVELTGQMGVPVIVVDGEVIIGFDRSRLEMLIAQGSATGRVKFGVKIANARNMPGALVGVVGSGGLGSKAGLASGDVVTEISGRPVRNAGDMEQVLGSIRAGDIVTVKFNRSGMERKSEIIAG